MANDDYRDQHQAAREVGLAARHETRVERAIRRQVAEEIAQAIEAHPSGGHKPFRIAAAIARQIGCPDCAKETS